MRGSKGGQGSGAIFLENFKVIEFLSNTGLDPLKNRKAIQASIHWKAIIGPPAKRHLNDDGQWYLWY